MVRLTHIILLAILLPVALALTACQATIHEKGTILNPKSVAQIKVGQTTRAQVKDLLGVPTFVNSFRRDRWSYVQDRQYKNVQRTFARVINRVEITFDQRGVVSDIQHNFDDELLDPKSLPSAKNTPNWFRWFWGGEYAQPATDGRLAERESPTEEGSRSASNAQGATSENRPVTNPWWRFWSSGKE